MLWVFLYNTSYMSADAGAPVRIKPLFHEIRLLCSNLCKSSSCCIITERCTVRGAQTYSGRSRVSPVSHLTYV